MTAVFVELDPNTLKAAEERELREQRAQSAIVRHARVDRSAFWRYVAAKQQAER